MPRSFVRAHRFSAHSMRSSLILALAAAALFFTAAARAQFAPPSPGTPVHDTSALHPPAGSRVAIVEFEDMECPDCGRANPLLKQAVAHYHIPWIRHDFLIPGHVWSPAAAINARWFDLKSKALGDEYRDEVFANQASMYTLDALRQFTDKFAQSHGIALPFAIDPQGKLAAAVKADKDLGIRIGVEHTPTIWIVTDHSKGAPFIEVTDRGKLFEIIDQAIADTTPAKAAAKSPGKAASKKAASN